MTAVMAAISDFSKSSLSSEFGGNANDFLCFLFHFGEFCSQAAVNDGLFVNFGQGLRKILKFDLRRPKPKSDNIRALMQY